MKIYTLSGIASGKTYPPPRRTLFLLMILLFPPLAYSQGQSQQQWKTDGNTVQTEESWLGTKNESSLILKTNKIEHIRLTPEGKLGIGTNAPEERFHLVGNGKVLGDFLTTGCFRAGCLNISGISTLNTLNVLDQIKIGNSIIIKGYNDGSPTNEIYTDPDADPNLYIQSNSSFSNNTIINHKNTGRVGIGTANPKSKFDVWGTGRFTSFNDIGFTEILHDSQNSQINSRDKGNLYLNYAAQDRNVESFGNLIAHKSLITNGDIFMQKNDPEINLIDNFPTSSSSTDEPTQLKLLASSGAVRFLANGSIKFFMDYKNEDNSNNRVFQVCANGGYFGDAKDLFKIHEMGLVTINPNNFNPGEKLLVNGKASFANTGGSVGIWFNTANGHINQTGGNALFLNYESRLPVISMGEFVVLEELGQNPIFKVNFEDRTTYVQGIKATLSNFPDYVFKKDYKLTPLLEVEKYIIKNGHLKNIPTAKEVAEKGLDLADSQRLAFEKIEEMTLYMIEIKKENIELRAEIEKLKKQNKPFRLFKKK